MYDFAWKMLAWSITVALLLPITIPWGMVSYKIWHGATPIEEELKEQLWWRSLWASIALALAGAGFGLLDFAIVDWFEFPPGPIHIFVLIAYLGIGSWALMYFFSLEDFFQGLIMLFIYWYLPVGLMYLIARLIPNPLFDYVLKWLQEPKI